MNVPTKRQDWLNGYKKKAPIYTERVTGRKARGSPNGGNRLQVSEVFISLKWQEETN